MADTDSEVLVTHHGALATVTLNRPEALNAITPTMLVTLGDELDALATDPGLEVVVLTGSGRAFSAGVDLKALGKHFTRGINRFEVEAAGRRAEVLLDIEL